MGLQVAAGCLEALRRPSGGPQEASGCCFGPSGTARGRGRPWALGLTCFRGGYKANLFPILYEFMFYIYIVINTIQSLAAKFWIHLSVLWEER
jgi:hypothetical protein